MKKLALLQLLLLPLAGLADVVNASEVDTQVERCEHVVRAEAAAQQARAAAESKQAEPAPAAGSKHAPEAPR